MSKKEESNICNKKLYKKIMELKRKQKEENEREKKIKIYSKLYSSPQYKYDDITNKIIVVFG
jgi:hypothetical protein